MLNRHAIVLFLGNAAMLLLHPPLARAAAPIGAWFLLLLIGLLLDTGRAGPRTLLAHALQAAAILLLAIDVALMLPGGAQALPVAAGEVGISLAALGILVEMRAPYRALRLGAATQCAGDLLFAAAFAYAVLRRSVTPSTVGWVFVGIAGAVSLYAAISNAILQLARIANPQAGWRFRVMGLADDVMTLQTPHGKAELKWGHVKSIERLDARHVILVLPAPLPPEVVQAGFPLEELRQSPEPPPPGATVPPDAFGFILHEQELGQPLEAARASLAAHVPPAA